MTLQSANMSSSDASQRIALQHTSIARTRANMADEEAPSGLLIKLVLALVSCFIFIFIAFAMLSTHANAHLFQASPRRASQNGVGGEDKDEEVKSQNRDGPIQCTREVLSRLYECLDDAARASYGYSDGDDGSSTAIGSPAPSALTATPPTPTLGAGAEEGGTPTPPPVEWARVDWDWVHEGEDELDDERLERALRSAGFGFRGQASASAGDEVSFRDRDVQEESLSAGHGSIGLGLLTPPLTPPTTPSPASTPSSHRQVSSRPHWSASRKGYESNTSNSNDDDEDDDAPTLRHQPTCASLECECDASMRRLCPLSEEKDEDEDAGSVAVRPCVGLGTAATGAGQPRKKTQGAQRLSKLSKLARSPAIRRMLSPSRSSSAPDKL